MALVKPEDGGGLGQIEFLPGDDDEDEDDDDDDDDLLDFWGNLRFCSWRAWKDLIVQLHISTDIAW